MLITAFWKYRPEFEKDDKVDSFAIYNLSATVNSIKKKGDTIREKTTQLTTKKKDYKDRIAQIEDGGGVILEDDEYHAIRAKYKRLALLFSLIFLAEAGLNYFTSLIAIPLTDETRGFFFTILRLSLAFVVTAIGIICADHLFEEVIPTQKYKPHNDDTLNVKKPFNIVRMILWLVGLVVVEYMIYHFGLARVNDIEGGFVNNDTAKSLIILSMIVPVIAGGINWEISNYKDAYLNRVKFDDCTSSINKIDNKIEFLKAAENSYFQKEVIGYWQGFNRLKAFKEYYNNNKGRETSQLSEKQQYAIDYDSYYAKALSEYNKHIEDNKPKHKDPIGK